MRGFERFEVIPAVDIQDGTAVQLVGGERGTETDYGDPVSAAERWVEAGASILHLVDLDGAFEGRRANAPHIEGIVSTVGDSVEVQVGGGIRTVADARDLLDRGVSRVIIGTAALGDPSIVSAIDDSHPGSVMVSLDASEGEVKVAGWTEGTGIDPVEAARRFEDRGAGSILFTDIEVEGRMGGVRADRVGRLAEAVDLPVVASGGVSSIADILHVQEAGAAGVVVGTALYRGAFSLEEALAAVR